MRKMNKNEKHIYFSDKLAILICFIMAIYSIFVYKEYCFPFVVYYLVMFLFRVIVLLLQSIIVRKNDSALKKFKKERFLCRFVGILLIFVDLVFAYLLAVEGIVKNYDTVNKYPWLISVYGLYAAYKIISAFLGFRKSRKSISPYRDIMGALNYLDAMLSVMSIIFMIWQPVIDLENRTAAYDFQLYFVIVLVVTSLVVIFKVIISRRVPDSLK